MAASLPNATGAGKDFDALFAELRSDLGEDNFRNFLVALSGRKPKEVKYHPEKSRHKELFEPQKWHKWIVPELSKVLSKFQETGSIADVDLQSFAELKALGPGIFSFPCFTDEFCQMILEEVRHYQQSDLPERPPNSMNNYGLVLNEIGMMPLFTEMLSHVMSPLAARLFGNEKDRVASLKGQPTIGNWGGSQLDTHHTFVVQYAVENDKNLDMHIDECDITFNIGLTESPDFEGNQLAFCGMYDADDHRRHQLTYSHVRGQCVVHCGKQRHGALDIEHGERASLIMWTKSHAFRRTAEYKKLYDLTRWNLSAADRICMSYSHDDDYEELMPEDLRFQMPKPDPLEPALCPATSTEGTAWSFLCDDSEVSEGQRQVFQVFGHDVLVLRHQGSLFAMEDRCSHMGSSLAAGDLEDLADGRQTLRCPGHGVCFDLRTGSSNKSYQQKVYPLRLVDGKIQVLVDRKRKRSAEIEVQE